MARHSSVMPEADTVAVESAVQLKGFTHKAFTEKIHQGHSDTYNKLVDQVRQLDRQARDSEQAAQALTSLLAAITGSCAVIAPRRHESLLSAVLGIPLWSSHKKVRRAVLDFVANLVPASGQCVPLCLEMLVGGLLPPPQPPGGDDEQAGPWIPQPQHTEVQGDVVATLERVLALVPTSPKHVVQRLAAGMPHKLRDRNTHALYVSALIALSEGQAGAAVREPLLGLIVDHLISIDVEIKWEDIVDQAAGQEAQEEGESDPEDADDIFQLEGMTALEIASRGDGVDNSIPRAEPDPAAIGWEGPASTATGVNRSYLDAGKAPSVDENAEKLDTLMELTLAHLRRMCDAGQLEQMWTTVMESFSRTILHTHRSKFTQYLVFYLCSREPTACTNSLCHLLMAQLEDNRAAPITKAACAAYLASFLARGKYIPRELVAAVLQAMADWSVRYLALEDSRALTRSASARGLYNEERAPMVNSQGAETRHQVFYAVCQAILYVLCYHLEPILQQAEPSLVLALQRLVSQHLQGILSHRLNPLAKCLPSVSEEFLRQTSTLKLIDRTQWDKRLGDGGARESRPLEMFFPFDPYLLLRSRVALELKENYVTWRSGHPSVGPKQDDNGNDTNSAASTAGSESEEEDEEDSESDGEEEGDEEDDTEQRTRFGSMASSDPMGVSPSPLGVSPFGSSFHAARRTFSAQAGLDSFAGGHMPVGLAHQASLNQWGHHGGSRGYPVSDAGTEGSDTPVGGSPLPIAGFGQPSQLGASPMSLGGCTPTNGFGAYMQKAKDGSRRKRK